MGMPAQSSAWHTYFVSTVCRGGAAISVFLAPRTSFSGLSTWLFLWMGAFGMAARGATGSPELTPSFGARRSPGISRGIEALQDVCASLAGECCGSGSTPLRRRGLWQPVSGVPSAGTLPSRRPPPQRTVLTASPCVVPDLCRASPSTLRFWSWFSVP